MAALLGLSGWMLTSAVQFNVSLARFEANLNAAADVANDLRRDMEQKFDSLLDDIGTIGGAVASTTGRVTNLEVEAAGTKGILEAMRQDIVATREDVRWLRRQSGVVQPTGGP